MKIKIKKYVMEINDSFCALDLNFTKNRLWNKLSFEIRGIKSLENLKKFNSL